MTKWKRLRKLREKKRFEAKALRPKAEGEEVKQTEPDIKVLISGIGADEIMAHNSYYSCGWGNVDVFPDDLSKPSRTIITSEGGKQPSRFKHVVKSGKRYRRLTPVELELLNEFPKNFTKHPEVSDSKRAFLMGNALVVGVITKIGNA